MATTDILKTIQKTQNISQSELGDDLNNYPFSNKQTDKTVTFVSPVLNAEGIYKMIFPATALNLYSKTHRAFVIGIQNYKHHRWTQDEYGCVLPEMAIEQSNWIVLPFLSEDATQLIGELREMNKNLKIGYCVDLNFLEIPPNHPGYPVYHDDKVANRIIANMRASDLVITTNIHLDEYLFLNLKDELKGSGIEQKLMPIGFFPEITEPILRTELPDIESEKLRIGIIGNPYHADDFISIKSQLKGIVKVYGSEIELISFGWRGMMKGETVNVFDGIPVTYERPVNFYDYYRKLIQLQLDCVLIPVAQDEAGFYKSSKNYSKYVELSACGIPCLITATEPYTGINMPPWGKPICTPERDAILIEKPDDWVTEIGLILENAKVIDNPDVPARLDTIANGAYQSALTRFDYKNLTPVIERMFT